MIRDFKTRNYLSVKSNLRNLNIVTFIYLVYLKIYVIISFLFILLMKLIKILLIHMKLIKSLLNYLYIYYYLKKLYEFLIKFL